MADYFTILTTTGKGLVAQSIASGTPINLTQVAVGDGSYTPNEGQTSLVSEQWRDSINQISRPDENPDWVVIEAVIPPEDGGWYVREVGVFDANGDLFAIAKYPESYKPVLDEGSGKDLYIKMILEVSNQAAVTLQIDPAVVLATREYVDDENESQTEELLDVLHNHRHTGRSSVDDGAIDYAAATGSGNAYAITPSPALDAYIPGMPIVFKANHDNTGAATLNVNSLGAVGVKRVAVDVDPGDIKDGQLIIVIYDGTNFQIQNPPNEVGIPFPVLSETPPSGALELDGSAISRTTYASLYAIYGTMFGVGDGSTTFNLPDARGQFLRGWDHGAGVDPDAASRTDRGDGTTGDHVGTKQDHNVEDHTHPLSASGELQTGSSNWRLTTPVTGATITPSGSDETRPVNINVMWCTRY